MQNVDKALKNPQLIDNSIKPRISVAPMMDWTINLKYILNINNL